MSGWKALARKLRAENRRQKRLLAWILCRIAQLPSPELATIEKGWTELEGSETCDLPPGLRFARPPSKARGQA